MWLVEWFKTTLKKKTCFGIIVWLGFGRRMLVLDQCKTET